MHGFDPFLKRIGLINVGVNGALAEEIKNGFSAFLAQYMLNRDLEASLEAGLVAAAQAVSRLGAFDAVLVPWPGDSGDGR